MKNKLVMTLLVRDEEDILEYNICHHLNQGVDFIVAIDNGSTDRTVQILKKYQRKKILSYSIVNKHTYEQDIWVSQMAKEAVNKFEATHLFHCDADEFWLAKKGNLKDQLINIKDVAYVSFVNYIPPSISVNKFSFDNFHYIVSNPIPCPKNFNILDSSKALIYEYSRKVMTTNKFININYGNHTVKYDGKYHRQLMNDIFIHHFSIQSYTHFRRKVINGGRAYLNNPIKKRITGWQWKKWYALYLKNMLKNEYNKISLNSTLSEYINKNIVRRARVPFKIKYAKTIYILTEIKNKFMKFI